MSGVKSRVNAYAARPSVLKVMDRNDRITDANTGHIWPQRASLMRASKAAVLIFMYMHYIYADEISIVSAYFGLPQCTASGPAGYSA